MELYLMQHGLALASEDDPEQPLSREGVVQMQMAGRALKRLGVVPDLLACSSKKRSRQSAALIAEAVNFPYSDILESDLLLPLTPPRESLRLLRGNGENGTGAIIVVGHLPSLAEIASLLLGQGSRVRIHFENGGLCRLDLPADASQLAELRYSLTAPQLKLIAA
ncbi:phosphohistidine phosphatase SixA [Desulfuromonas carbonis]